MKTAKKDRSFVMNTIMLEVSAQEDINMDDLTTRESVRNDGSWVVIHKPSKKVMYRKQF